MNAVELKKERPVWIGSLVVLVLLTIFPFTSQQGGIFAFVRQGDFSKTIWNLLGEFPVLSALLGIVLLNALLAIIQFDDRIKNHLTLGFSLLGVALFIIQFVVWRPDIPLGFGSFVLFFSLLL